MRGKGPLVPDVLNYRVCVYLWVGFFVVFVYCAPEYFVGKYHERLCEKYVFFPSNEKLKTTIS